MAEELRQWWTSMANGWKEASEKELEYQGCDSSVRKGMKRA
jgi:hypothetical protein